MNVKCPCCGAEFALVPVVPTPAPAPGYPPGSVYVAPNSMPADHTPRYRPWPPNHYQPQLRADGSCCDGAPSEYRPEGAD